MASGNKTTSIARPRQVSTRHHGHRTSRDRDQTLFGDLTRPIRPDRQLVRRRRARVALAVVTLGVLGVLGAYLFVLPVQTYLDQQEQLEAKQAELDVLVDANRQLADEVRRLRTADGAEEAARDELGVVAPGEERVSMVPGDDAPLPLPTGFPYDAVAAIVAVRQTATLAVPAPSASLP
jgi:cell division protein FtsB